MWHLELDEPRGAWWVMFTLADDVAINEGMSTEKKLTLFRRSWSLTTRRGDEGIYEVNPRCRGVTAMIYRRIHARSEAVEKSIEVSTTTNTLPPRNGRYPACVLPSLRHPLVLQGPRPQPFDFHFVQPRRHFL